MGSIEQMAEKWHDGGKPLWFVIGENGSLWCSTVSMSKKQAMERWEFETGDPWRKWYRRGFRCRQVKLRYQIQS